MRSNNLNEKNKYKFFYNLCKDKFTYLIAEYNCALVSARKDGKLFEIIFQNKTTAVIINWDRSENWIYIELHRLINGKLLKIPVIITAQTELNGYYLDDLLSIRNPDFTPAKIPLDDKDIEAVLTNYSIMLHEYADDVLNGDFAIFNDLEKIIKRRIAFLKDETN